MKADSLLRAFLILGALTWGVAGIGVFVPWDVAVDALHGLGAENIGYDRMLDYWFRMASGAFALIGMLFALCAIYPRNHKELIPWLAALMNIEGCVLAIHGMRLGMAGFPFYADIAACFVTGFGILWCLRSRATVDLAEPVAPPNAGS